MTMKLPLILSAMLAAFAISGTNASEPTPDEAAATEAAPAEAAPAEAAAPAAETAKPAAKKKGKRHHAHAAEATGDEPKAKRHHRRHRHHGGSGHVGDKWDQPWDYIQQGGDSSGCSGGSSDESPRMPVPEVPGQKTP